MGIGKFLKRFRNVSPESELSLSATQEIDANGDEFVASLFRAHNLIGSEHPTIYSKAAYEIISVRKELAHSHEAGYRSGNRDALGECTALATANDSLRHENDQVRKENQVLLNSNRKMLLFLAEQQAKGNIDKVPNFDNMP